MMSLPRDIVVTTFFLVLVALPGCQKSPLSETNRSQSLTSDPEGEGHHDEDHEHLEHFVPPHKPASFEELVSQLAFRCETVPKLAAADEKEFQKRSVELRDIIQWIPELSADSNLKRQEFETAVSAGAGLSLALGFERPAEGSKAVDQSSIPKLLDELKALVSKSQISTEPM